MDKEKIKEITNDVSIVRNADLYEARDILLKEFETSKQLILDLTHHIDAIEIMYNKINEEIGKRVKV